MLETLKALADPCRLRLTAVLLTGEFTVQELTLRQIAWYGRFKGVIHPLFQWSTELLSAGDALEGPAGNGDLGEASSAHNR